MLDALSVKRNAAIGVAVGLTIATLAYIVRVFELLGPIAGGRRYPVFGPELWFGLLAFVFAAATALGVTLLLTAFNAYTLTQQVSREEIE